MPETISFNGLDLRFLHSKDDTDGSIDVFEMTVQPNARMPIPHHHDRWDETVYGLTGVTTWRVDGQDTQVAPGQSVFIKRGIVHGATDELGFHAVENRHYVTDIHATVFHQLGLDPRRLEVPGQKRLDVDYGNPIKEILS